MQEHPLIGLGDIQKLTHFFRIDFFDITEDDDLPLIRRECLDRLL